MRPEKADVFSRSETCRGNSQNPVAWIAEWRETETLKPIDKPSKDGRESSGCNEGERRGSLENC